MTKDVISIGLNVYLLIILTTYRLKAWLNLCPKSSATSVTSLRVEYLRLVFKKYF